MATLLVYCTSCNTKANNVNNRDSSVVAVYTFPVQDGFGYSIFINNKEYIRQDCVPVIQGNKPFASENKAKKTGVFVAQKIQHNQLPTLTLAELRQLNVIK